MDFTIRAVRPEEYEELGDLTGLTYLNDGLLLHGEDDSYLAVLRDTARRARESEVLVAVDADERLVGGVTFARGGTAWADIAVEGEAEFRMLVVGPDARGRGIGEALVRVCLDRAQALSGCARLVLSTGETMVAAHRIYERMGFVRTPERDWEPVPDHLLRTYALEF
ncbi:MULTISPECIES: GNAT family N-acetyltransferase [unclassified Streptomyces]|uniref:GNAT family N-acetyltransferase n=1 Tax=unclassified Streptomyces TaxID=2593676 RepID=UPI0016616388|nr:MULTISPECIES: GNAT family N-acetyltransferase [unclassified Streptomyces]MBD0707458.1 GNAT family N-acetyltransferase [Streptomyces sp. CBMA291]MBD0716161.1 GNAT family N-acetyltransferase [Streptomyces sp. CBMA370]